MNGVNSNGINRAAPVMMPVSAYDLPPEDWETESMIPPATAVSSGSDSAMTPSMSESLDQRKRETIARCIEEAKRLNKKLLFGMTTSLVLQSVPLPVDCDLDESLLHTVSSAKNKRIRVKNSPLCTHIWKHVARAGVVEIGRNVYALDLFHTWAQLSAHVSLRTLIVLGDAIITAMSRQPALSQGRDAVTIYHDLIRFVEELPHFKGRTMCVRALPLIMPGVDSPKESEERLSLLTHGIPQPVVNYVVPDMTFRSGAPVTLDLAWPEFKVAIEYDGDHHRTNKAQWRRDQEKRSKLVARQWITFVATAANLADEAACAEFSFNVARALALRGAVFDFQVIAMSIEQLAETRLRRQG